MVASRKNWFRIDGVELLVESIKRSEISLNNNRYVRAPRPMYLSGFVARCLGTVYHDDNRTERFWQPWWFSWWWWDESTAVHLHLCFYPIFIPTLTYSDGRFKVSVSLILNIEETLSQLPCYRHHINRLHPVLVLVFDLIIILGLFLSSYLVIFPTMFQFELARDLIWVSTF